MYRKLCFLLVVSMVVAACGGSIASPSPGSTAGGGATSTAMPVAATASPAAVPTASPRYVPTPRSSAAMAWDPTSKRVLLFGGDTSSGASNALDAWDGTTWTSLGGGPPARDDALLVADPSRGVVVLTGGRSGQTPLTDTWEWNGSAWKKIDVQGFTPRAHAAAAYDPVSKRVLVYGGVSETGTLRDTWAWDGTSWKKLEAKGIPARIPNGMAWDPTRKQLLTLAVNLDAPKADQTYPSEVWGWTGKGWELVSERGPSFSPLQQLSEGAAHPWFIDGGAVQRQFSTQTWNGTEWLPLVGPAPAVRNGQAVAFDPERGQLVLFGGFLDNTTFGDTWVNDGVSWHVVGP